MSADFVTGYFFEALKMAAMLATPILVAGLAVGVLVSMFQAATQINEMTLVFIPKMLAVGFALLFFFPWMVEIMVEFTQNLLTGIPDFAH